MTFFAPSGLIVQGGGPDDAGRRNTAMHLHSLVSDDETRQAVCEELAPLRDLPQLVVHVAQAAKASKGRVDVSHRLGPRRQLGFHEGGVVVDEARFTASAGLVRQVRWPA